MRTAHGRTLTYRGRQRSYSRHCRSWPTDFKPSTGIASSITFGASGPTRRADQARRSVRCLSVRQRVFCQRPCRRWVHQVRLGASLRTWIAGPRGVSRRCGQNVQTLGELDKPEIKKIALANPATAPTARRASRLWRRAGLWDQLQAKDRDRRIGATGPSLCSKGRRRGGAGWPGHRQRPRSASWSRSTPQLYDPIIQALGVIAASKRTADAERFVAVHSGRGRSAHLEGIWIRSAE